MRALSESTDRREERGFARSAAERAFSSPCRWTAVVLVILAALAWTAPVGAQQAGAEQPPTPPGAAELDPASIQSRIEALQARQQPQGGGLAEPERAGLDHLVAARQHLEEAAQIRARAQEFSEAARGAPELIARFEQELARPLDEAVPNVPEDATIEALQSAQEAARGRLEAAKQLKQRAAQDQTERTLRREAIPAERATALEGLEEVRSQLAAAPDPESPPEVVSARRARLLAREQLIEATIRKLDEEIRSYDARRDLLSKRQAVADRRIAVETQYLQALEQAINRKRAQAAEAERREAARAAREAATAHPLVQEILERNAELAARRSEIVAEITEVTEQRQEIAEQRLRWTEAFERSRDLVQDIGLTDAVGLHLRNQRARLPEIRVNERRMRVRKEEIGDTQFAINQLQYELEELSDLDAAVARRIGQSTAQEPIPPGQLEEVREAVREALAKQREIIDGLIESYNNYDNILIDAQKAEQELVSRVEAYRDFIDERILWIQSTHAMRFTGVDGAAADWRVALDSLDVFVDVDTWRRTAGSLWTGLRRDPVGLVALVGLVVVLLAARRRLKSRLDDLANAAAKPTKDRFGLTVFAGVLTILLAAPWAVLLATIGWRLRGSPDASDFMISLAAGFSRAAAFVFAMQLLYHLCRPRGLGDVHFGWRQPNMRLMRRELRWFVPAMTPLAILITYTERAGDIPYNSLGRFIFIAGMLALAVVLYRLFRPQDGLLSGFIQAHRGGWMDRLRYVWFALIVGAPLALIVLAASGYFYTSVQLQRRILQTALLVPVVIVAYELFLRWLTIAQRKLAIDQARKKYSALAQQAKAKGEGDGKTDATEVTYAVEEAQIDVAAVSAQTQRLLRTLVGFGMVIGVALIWADVLPALNKLDDVVLWEQTQTVTETVQQNGEAVEQAVERSLAFTLADVIIALLIVAITVAVSKNIPGLLEIAVLQRLPITYSARYAVTTVVRYALVIIGAVLAFNAVGIGWSKVQWLAAAITVGLGFGLQEIFANFVSGLIILFERPIRVGDTVTVGSISGTVARVRMRATTVVDWDRKELIIPNKEFVTGQVINWTLTDPVLRVIIPVGIAYGSDVELARRKLMEVAQASDTVLDDPPPRALFLGFGDSSLNFELRVFIPHMDYFLAVRDEMHSKIDAAFREAGVEIAFPQRDIHVRSIKAALPVHARADGNVVDAEAVLGGGGSQR